MSTCRLCGQSIDILIALNALYAVPGAHDKQVINQAVAEILLLRADLAALTEKRKAVKPGK